MSDDAGYFMREAQDYDSILHRALALARERYPEASAQKQAAFANAVAELVTHMSGGFGGPSVREHAAAQLSGRQYSFDEAVELLIDPEGVIFGPITDIHREIWAEMGDICFDDDPQDIAELDLPPGARN